MHFRQFVQQSDNLGKSVWLLLYGAVDQMLVGSLVIEQGKTTLRERQGEYYGKDDKVPIVLAPYSHLICLLIIANPFHLIFN